MLPPRWQKILRESWGEAPPADPDEFQQILRRLQMPRRETLSERSLALLCFTSLALSVTVTIFVVPPRQTGNDAQTEKSSIFSVEVTNPYDESLGQLEELADMGSSYP